MWKLKLTLSFLVKCRRAQDEQQPVEELSNKWKICLKIVSAVTN